MILDCDHLHFPIYSIHSILQYVEFIFLLNFNEARIPKQIVLFLLYHPLFKFWRYILFQFKDFLLNRFLHNHLLQFTVSLHNSFKILIIHLDNLFA